MHGWYMYIAYIARASGRVDGSPCDFFATEAPAGKLSPNLSPPRAEHQCASARRTEHQCAPVCTTGVRYRHGYRG